MADVGSGMPMIASDMTYTVLIATRRNKTNIE